MNGSPTGTAPPAPIRGEARSAAWQLLRHGTALADADVGAGHGELRDALAGFERDGDAEGRLLAAGVLVQCIGIVDADYAGFEDAVAAIDACAESVDAIADPGDRLSARAGALVAGWFESLDDPRLPERAAEIVRGLGDADVAAPVRARAGLSALGYFEARARLEDVLWVELAMRPVLDDESVSPRLADEWHHMLVQAFYQCGAPERAAALRGERQATGRALLPAIELKLLLLDAQIEIGDGRVDAGRAALARAAPLLVPSAPRPASWWHLLRSRLHLVEGQHRDALVHARLALRLAQESRLPERWMGVTVMQEGQVQMASGSPGAAVPFFERAARAASGVQADFCRCLAQFARALDGFGAGNFDIGRASLRQGFALARRLGWTGFLRACPRVAASLCEHALEHGIEDAFVREVVSARGLEAGRRDLAAWPWPIRIATLGRFAIELDGSPLAFRGKVAKKPLELLQFVIASSGSDVSIHTATFAIWPDLDGDNAKAALNTALHRLRKLLGSDDAVLLELGRLSLNGRLVWVDCLAFEQLADGVHDSPSAPLAPAGAAAARRALALYGGAFLHDSEDHAWQMVCRTRIASKYKRLVAMLVRQAVAAADLGAARSLLERALEFDPLAEDLARELMRVLIESGEQAAALSVFERCRDAIAESLGATPSPATLALLARLRPRLGGRRVTAGGPTIEGSWPGESVSDP
ncbi:MAG: AfsR/SARP family transcriptional regulator [Caldimonas sp.]